MLEAALERQSTLLAEFLLAGQEATPAADRSSRLAPDGAYETLDRVLFLTVHGNRDWCRFTETLSCPALADDPRFATNSGRVRHQEALDAILRPIFAAKSALWWLRVLQRHGIASGIAHEFETFRYHEQVQANGHVAELQSPWGQIAVGGTPWHFSRTPAQVVPPASPGADKIGRASCRARVCQYV